MTAAIAPDPRRRGTDGTHLRLPQLHRRLTPPLGGPAASRSASHSASHSASRSASRSKGRPPRAAFA